MNYPRILYHLFYIASSCVLVGAFYYYARKVTKHPEFLPDFMPRLRIIKEECFKLFGILVATSIGFFTLGGLILIPFFVFWSPSLEQIVALFLAAYIASLVGYYQEREKIRKLLESQRQHGEQLYETSRRLLHETRLGEQLSDTVARLDKERLDGVLKEMRP